MWKLESMSASQSGPSHNRGAHGLRRAGTHDPLAVAADRSGARDRPARGDPRHFDFAQDGRRDYYGFGGAVVAMKEGVVGPTPRALYYLRGDHPSTSLGTGLGSVSLTTNKSGQKVSERPSAGSGQAATSRMARYAGAAARACRLTLRQTG